VVRKLLTFALSAAAISCAAQQPWSFNLADFLAAEELPYDTPPQVIYRIDDHRFVTLEHYRDCNHGESFYNDTKKNIKRKLGGNGYFENFQGTIVNADPSGKNLVFPLSYPPRLVCGDRGCTVKLWYSIDGGESFHAMTYSADNFNPFEYSKRYIVAATSDALYVSEKLGDTTSQTAVSRYRLVPGVVYSSKHGPIEEYNATLPLGLSTPSGQDHITCDASIKPTNPDAPLVRERQQ